MTGITHHLSAADVVLDLAAGGKAEVLQRLAAAAADRLGRPAGEVLEALQARERLGSTALGRGVALPHARLSGDAAPVVIFARLRRAIDFDARDEEPVDLVILVLWPDAEPEGFLPMLSETCRALRDPATLRQLRGAPTAREVIDVLAGSGATGRA
jgi:PTS system nitrogen regulatory IIA component